MLQNEKYKTIDSPYIKFDPKIGYTIDLSQYNGAFGRYKCAMNEEDSFPAYFNLRNGLFLSSFIFYRINSSNNSNTIIQ